jgi:CubicO group peptidase (beta-lactamase class C family)
MLAGKTIINSYRTFGAYQVIVMAVGLLIASAVLAAAPFINPADDAKNFGPPESSLFWTPEQQVAGYRNMDKIFPTRQIKAGTKPLLLPYAEADLDNVEIRYDAGVMTTDEYFEKQSVAGLLVIKDGEIVYERYGLGNTEDSVWGSYSVAKSVTSMLIGAAIRDGYIASVDEKVSDYLPRLKGSSYDQSTIRNVLQMSSGVQWDEDYADPESDINKNGWWSTLGSYEYLKNKPRDSIPGDVFNYNTAETNLAGTLLRSAVGNNLATYLAEKIWRPFGMESDANWVLTEFGGGEWGGCCISATLRDYGRLGLFALANGKLADGRSVLPDDWMTESTSSSKGNPGYGYLWWLHDDGTYSARGIFGQGIYINQAENVVIALHSARPVASSQADKDLQHALYAALTEALAGR